MLEWLSQQNAGQLIGLAAVLIGPVIAVTAIVSGAWMRVRRTEAQVHIAEIEAGLKQQMIERGMSADEIERVLAAGNSKKAKRDAVAEVQAV